MKTTSYLGVTITKRVDDLYKANYIKVDEDTVRDMERWAVLPLPIRDRIMAKHLIEQMDVVTRLTLWDVFARKINELG